MKIKVREEADKLILEFAPYGNGQRLWIRSTANWYPSLGWCPHLNIGGGECRDCSMALENEDD